MKGFWHLVDAVLASVILLGAVLVMGQTAVIVPEPGNTNIIAFEKLRELDEQGIMRAYVMDGDYTGLDSHVTLYTFNHSVQICDYSGNCVGERPINKNVWVGTYIVSGKDYYNPRTVKLYIW